MTGSTSLEDRVGRSMSTLADAVEPRLALDDVTAGRSVAPSGGRRWMASAAAAAVVLVGGTGMWLGRTENSPTNAPTSTVDVETAPPKFFLPASVPSGFELTTAEHHEAGPTANPSPSVVLAVPWGAGFRNPIEVSTLDGPVTDHEVVYEHEPVQLADGTVAELLRDEANGSSLLQWTTAEGPTVVIWNNVLGNQADTDELLTGVADAVSVVDGRLTVGDSLPAALEVVATEPASWSGTGSQLVYEADDGSGSIPSIFVTVTVDPPTDWRFFGIADYLEPHPIANRPGFASEHQYPQHEEQMPPTRTVSWLAQPDVLIRISGEGLTFEQLAAFAASFQPVDEATWLERTGDTDPSTT